jgi:outer membrane protein OmpA-like peptidoglycan-associated protein
LVTGGFSIFGPDTNINFTELAKSITSAAAAAGPKYVKEIIEGVGAGVEVAKKTVGVGSDAWDLYRKIRVDISDRNPPPPVPEGVFLDRRISFRFNSAKLDDDMRDALRPLAEKLRKEHTTVLIEGHADGEGTAAYNLTLSQQRADAVKKFLVDNDVPANQLHPYGYGQGYFWLPYISKDGANRRVRITECTVAGTDRCKSGAASVEQFRSLATSKRG